MFFNRTKVPHEVSTVESGLGADNVETAGEDIKPGDQQSASRVVLLLTSLLTTVFLVALDRTIITTVRVVGRILIDLDYCAIQKLTQRRLYLASRTNSILCLM